MGSEWRKVKLAQLLEVKGGKRLPAGVNLVETPNDHPYIRVRDLSGARTLELNAQYLFVDNETQKLIKNYIVAIGDIVISIVGTIGLIAIVGKSLEKANLTENCVKLTNLQGVESLFLYYFLKSPLGQNEIARGTVGAVQAKLPIKNILNIELELPPLAEQRFIAATLSSLDDKIELNNRIIANLEAQAQAIFKSWFVDFEPFQDGELEESEMGLIPKGWRVTRLGELCESVSITHNFKKRELIFLNTGDIDQGRFLHSNYSAVDLMPGQAKKSIKKNDILYSEIRPINKHFAYVNFDSEDYVVSTKLMVIRSRKINSRRLYQFLTKQDVLEELQVEAEARSGTFPQIRFENIQRMVIVLATQIVEENYNSILEPIYQLIDQRVEENKQLILVRDTLLPKLMSGEIEVPVEG